MDLTERLRAKAPMDITARYNMQCEAADTIDALRERVKVLEGALSRVDVFMSLDKSVLDAMSNDEWVAHNRIRSVIRAALKEADT